MLQIANITSADEFTNTGEYSFRTFPKSSYYAGAVGKIARKNGSKKMALLYEQKDYTKSTAMAVKETFKKNGGKVVNSQAFKQKENNFDTYLLKVKNSNADSIYFAPQGANSAVNFYEDLKELEMMDDYKVYSNTVGAYKAVYEKSNGLNAGVKATDMHVDPERPKTKSMLEAFKKTYGDYPETNDIYVATSYDSLKIVAQGIEKCGEVDTDCLKNYMYDVNWNGAAGKLDFNLKGDVYPPVGLHYMSENGKSIWKKINTKEN